MLRAHGGAGYTFEALAILVVLPPGKKPSRAQLCARHWTSRRRLGGGDWRHWAGVSPINTSVRTYTTYARGSPALQYSGYSSSGAARRHCHGGTAAAATRSRLQSRLLGPNVVDKHITSLSRGWALRHYYLPCFSPPMGWGSSRSATSAAEPGDSVEARSASSAAVMTRRGEPNCGAGSDFQNAIAWRVRTRSTVRTCMYRRTGAGGASGGRAQRRAARRHHQPPRLRQASQRLEL